MDTTIEHDGRLWKPKPGCSSTFEQFLAARMLFKELHRQAHWNPWVLDDRAADNDRAMTVMDEWTRGEPNFRPLTEKQLDARMARWQRQYDAEHAKVEQRWERDKQRYDPDRETARLALIEQQSRQDFELAEAAGLRAGTIFPAMAEDRRAAQIAEAEAQIAERQQDIERITPLVGDPEDVVDARGWLPRDRRDMNLTVFSACRSVRVRELRPIVAELTSQMKATKDKAERAEHRTKLKEAAGRLDELLVIPELSADDMCSECAKPFASHGWILTRTKGPCWAWPRAAAQRQKLREMFDSFVRASQPPEPPALPRPQPLAVIPSRLPITEVLSRLTEIQAEYPDAEVRRGNANKWEVWAPAPPRI